MRHWRCRYKGLFARPRVAQALSAERNALAGLLSQYVNALKDELDARMDASPKRGTVVPAAPPGFRVTVCGIAIIGKVVTRPSIAQLNSVAVQGIVAKITFAAQLLTKAHTARTAATSLLAGLSNAKELLDGCEDLTKELGEFRDSEFKMWTEDITDALLARESPLALQTTGRVMQIDFDGDKKLRVNYSGRLVSLLREVRQLQALGFNVPREVVKATTDADKFYRLAVTLKQVANFYNSIGRQMLEFQKPMLIEPAKAFEAVISSKQDASLAWDNVAALEAYIGKLQTAASDLTVRNRRLRLAHKSLMEKAVALFSIDLVAKREQWKQALRDMRAIVEELQRAGYVGMKAWTTHIDKQIFKALEHQYALGLEALSENLPGMYVKLVFKHKKLQFEPPFEEIRTQYYREVKRFLSVPENIRGVGADGSPFKRMTRDNAAGVAIVFKKAEKLFSKLQRAVAPFGDWVALGTVDLEAFLETNLKTVSDWELNFKVLKQRGKEVRQLNTSHPIYCILCTSYFAWRC